MKILNRIIFAFILVAFTMAGSVTFIVWKYEDDLKQFVLDAVHSTIETDLYFNENVKLSFWSDFPLIAVEIEDIRIQDSFRTDTLLMAEKAFVQFNLIKLIRNEMTIEGIRISDGFVRLRRNANDEWNFKVWKAPETKDAEVNTQFNIEILTLESIQLDYDDRRVDLNIQFLSEKSKIKGRFTESDQRLALSLSGFMQRLTTTGADRIVDLPLNIATVLNINSSQNIYTIEMGNAILAGNEMVVDAEWRKLEGAMNMEMKVHAGNIDPASLLPHVWPQMPDNIKNLDLTGKADLIFSMSGPFKLNSGPKLEATIRLRDGSLKFRTIQVSDLNFETKLTMEDIKRSEVMTLKFESFELRTPVGEVKGEGTLTDLSDPYLKISTTGNSKLEELVAVTGLDSDLEANGPISWNIKFEGPLGHQFRTTLKELKQMNWSGSINLEKTSIKFDSGIPVLQNFEAEIAMRDGKTSVTSCKGEIGHLQFDGSIELDDLKSILTDSTYPIKLKGNMHVATLDVIKLPEEWELDSKNGDSKSARPVNLDLFASFDHVVYKDFHATSIQGQIKMQDNEVHVTDLSMTALGGTISASLRFSPTEEGSLLTLNGKLRNIDMSRTLAEWDNFGQHSITSQNLKGQTNSDLSTQIYMDRNMQIIRNKLMVEADVEVIGGELIKFEPLLALSKFIDVEELDRVRFDTLRNHLTIKDDKLIIPRMTVASSILNVDVFGQHSFEQEMDYHVNLLLNDLLRRKAKRQETFDGHEIIDEKGKTRLFLWVRGKPGAIKIGFDKKEVRKKLKDDFKQEGQTIKQLFKEEFNGARSSETESSEVEFRLEEDGISNKSVSNEADSKKEQPKKKKGLFSSEPDKEESEGGFEIEFNP